MKDIIGFEGKYKISEDGEIWSVKRNKFLKPFHKNGGYVRICLYVEKDKKIKGIQYSVHRLVAQTFIPNPLNYPQINHKDGNKTNNKVSNLEWCTPSQNQKHAYLTGLSKKKFGEDHYHCNHSNEEINIIKRTLVLKEIGEIYISDTVISKIFNIPKSSLTLIRKGQLYNF